MERSLSCDSFYEYQNYMDERDRLLDEIIAWQQEQKQQLDKISHIRASVLDIILVWMTCILLF